MCVMGAPITWPEPTAAYVQPAGVAWQALLTFDKAQFDLIAIALSFISCLNDSTRRVKVAPAANGLPDALVTRSVHWRLWRAWRSAALPCRGVCSQSSRASDS